MSTASDSERDDEVGSAAELSPDERPRAAEKPKRTRTHAKWFVLKEFERDKFEDQEITDGIFDIGFKSRN